MVYLASVLSRFRNSARIDWLLRIGRYPSWVCFCPFWFGHLAAALHLRKPQKLHTAKLQATHWKVHKSLYTQKVVASKFYFPWRTISSGHRLLLWGSSTFIYRLCFFQSLCNLLQLNTNKYRDSRTEVPKLCYRTILLPLVVGLGSYEFPFWQMEV